MTKKEEIIKKYAREYENITENTVIGLKKYPMEGLENIESYKLGKQGTVVIMDGKEEIFVQSYPELEAPLMEHDIPILPELNVAELKINGYNVRLVYLKSLDNFVALLRGGFIDTQTISILREAFGDKLLPFFRDNPEKVLCMEVVGKKSQANINYELNEELYGFGEVGYFVFDMFDIGKEGFWYDRSIKTACNKYGLMRVPELCTTEDGNFLLDRMETVNPYFEGVVLKSINSRDREHIYKLRWEYFLTKFSDKIEAPKRHEKKIRVEDVILTHFLQGYSEEEHGLKEGISPEEQKRFEDDVGLLEHIVKEEPQKIGKYVKLVGDYLMEILNKKGDFNEEMQKKLRKAVNRKMGGVVGRSMSKK